MKAFSLTAALLLLLPTAQCFTAPHRPVTIRIVRNVEPITRLSSAISNSSSPYASPQLDKAALAKYAVAAATELSLSAILFASLDALFALLPRSPPPLVASFLFYALSLKSRLLNPLNNARPVRSQAAAKNGEPSPGFRDRIMPSWTPPGFVFPIMWILIIGPLRARSSALVYQACSGKLLSLPTMAFMLHLTLGDVWNTVNNTEKRYGASVIGVILVLLSAIHASLRYYSVVPAAGKMLGCTCIWLSVATLLIGDTWRLNPVMMMDGGKSRRRAPLYPVKGEAETTFLWFGKQGNNSDGIVDEDNGANLNDGPGCKRLIDYDGEEKKGKEKIIYRNREHFMRSQGFD